MRFVCGIFPLANCLVRLTLRLRSAVTDAVFLGCSFLLAARLLFAGHAEADDLGHRDLFLAERVQRNDIGRFRRFLVLLRAFVARHRLWLLALLLGLLAADHSHRRFRSL